MDVFNCLPEAIETWQIGEMTYGTIEGNKLADAQNVRVIVDEGTSGDLNSAPNAATIASDTLIYAMPSDLPTTDTSTLVTDYAIKSPSGRIYAIIDAAQGRNQNKGHLEHIEMRLRPTGALEDESE